jgi:hypothetical protein
MKIVMKNKKDITVLRVTLFFCFIALFHSIFFLTAIASQEKKQIDLSGIHNIAAKYNIAITDWQHSSYNIYYDEKLIYDKASAIKWLKTNLYNWALKEDITNGKTIFYLLPKGVKSHKVVDHGSQKSNNLLSNENIKIITEAKVAAKGITIKNIFDIKEIKMLSSLSDKEKQQKLFYIRSLNEKNKESEYSFSIQWDDKEKKFRPFELNGYPVLSNKLEGFVCFDTVFQYIRMNASELKVEKSDQWLFLSTDKAPSSFIALRNTNEGLDIVAFNKAGNKTILQYDIRQKKEGFYSSTEIPVSGSKLFLSDIVSYY